MFTVLTILFVLGYAAIAMEQFIKVNKAASALMTGVGLWTVYIFLSPDKKIVVEQLVDHIGEFSGILFFLMSAMTIVEIIDAHNGFDLITQRIKTKNKLGLLWIISIVAFFLSAVLDNLTTTIVMVSLASKIIQNKEERMFFIGMIVIAANAGGAWSPIGDVTTTMLWIGGQLTSAHMISQLFLPSLLCVTVPLVFLSITMKGSITPGGDVQKNQSDCTTFQKNIIFFLGIFALLFVPFFKTLTHLPPYMGILFGLAILWIVTELIHKGNHPKDTYSVARALQRIDMPSILFFLGILISISALQATGMLSLAAVFLDTKIHNSTVIVMVIGLLSAIVDNVPLVAGAMGMYDLSTFPADHPFWTLLSYCAGTGGSALIIGSAAGVAAMGMAKIEFFWYVKKITPLSLLGYFAGIVIYMVQGRIFYKG
jgi:Na+/H+ antiporter NhaD/arsenite permease-like protein